MDQPARYRWRWVVILFALVFILGFACIAVYATLLAPNDTSGGQLPVEASPPPGTPPLVTVGAGETTPTGPPPALLPTPDLLARANEILASLPEGRMVFNPPAEMSLGRKETIELRIMPLSPGLTPEQIQSTLEHNIEGSGEPQIEAIKVGTRMRARLTGDEGLKVTLINAAEEQTIAADTFTQWVWEVEAVRAGERRLFLSVTVKVEAEGAGGIERDIPVITRVVNVPVDPVYSLRTFWSTEWKWVLVTFALPGAGLLFKSLKDRGIAQKDRKKSGPPGAKKPRP